jgi:hypothetical protein
LLTLLGYFNIFVASMTKKITILLFAACVTISYCLFATVTPIHNIVKEEAFLSLDHLHLNIVTDIFAGKRHETKYVYIKRYLENNFTTEIYHRNIIITAANSFFIRRQYYTSTQYFSSLTFRTRNLRGPPLSLLNLV